MPRTKKIHAMKTPAETRPEPKLAAEPEGRANEDNADSRTHHEREYLRDQIHLNLSGCCVRTETLSFLNQVLINFLSNSREHTPEDFMSALRDRVFLAERMDNGPGRVGGWVLNDVRLHSFFLSIRL
jgi:signal transduction histidine kinase